MTAAQLLTWQPSKLDSVAEALTSRRKKLVDLQDEMDGAKPPDTWLAGSASKAKARHEELRLQLLDMVAEVADVTINLDDAHFRIKTAKQALRDALSAAKAQGFDVNEQTGRVTDPRTYDEPTERDEAAVQVRAIAADIEAALKDAQQADLDLAQALKGAEKGKPEGGTGSLADAVSAQLPTRIDEMTPQERAALLGGDVSIHTVSAYIEFEAELASFEAEGAAKAEYKVMADGTVVMALHLEAGLGREISVGKAEADVSGGGTTDLEMKFDSPEEAMKFLQDLDDRALADLGPTDVITGRVPIEIARNVAGYVMEQDISSFKLGLYGQGEAEIKTPWLEAELKGRADAYVDTVKDQVGLKLEASASAELGGKGSGYDAAASMSGEIIYSTKGEFEEFKLAGKVDGVVGNDKLGLTAPPGTGTGTGFDVELVVDKENPAVDDINAAIREGDLDRARDLAFDNGRLIAKQTVIEQYGSDEQKVDLGFARGEYEYGARGETATQVWLREPGREHAIPVPLSELKANGGG